MSNLINQPNLGKEIVKQLNMIGIETFEQLTELGSEKTFVKLKALDESSCINKLYALEGAIQGIRWHQLTKERKSELLAFFNFTKL